MVVGGAFKPFDLLAVPRNWGMRMVGPALGIPATASVPQPRPVAPAGSTKPHHNMHAGGVVLGYSHLGMLAVSPGSCGVV